MNLDLYSSYYDDVMKISRQSFTMENKEHEVRKTAFFDTSSSASSDISQTATNRSTMINKEIKFDLFNNVCVCMIDIAGFSSWCSNHLPNMIAFAMLEYNQWILHNIKKFKGIKKIELVGDCCMLIGGIGAGEEYSLTECYIEVIRLAENLLEDIDTLRYIFKSNEINIRIGIHISDVIGIYLPSPDKYQMFGNDINICSRLENSAIPNTIHISEKTLICVQGTCAYTFSPCTRCIRGSVINQSYKGVGYKHSYLLFMIKNCIYFVNVNHFFYRKLINLLSPFQSSTDNSMTLCHTNCISTKYICIVVNVSNTRNIWSNIDNLLEVITKNLHFQQNIILLTNNENYDLIYSSYTYKVDHILNVEHTNFYSTLQKIMNSYIVLSKQKPERRSLDLTPF